MNKRVDSYVVVFVCLLLLSITLFPQSSKVNTGEIIEDENSITGYSISQFDELNSIDIYGSNSFSSSPGITRNIINGNFVIGVIDSGSKKYFHRDRIGNNRLMTDDFGFKISEFKSLPYGQTVLKSNFRYEFTGKEKDENGDYYFGARYYDSDVGKFLSVDPVIDNHAFSYVENNPLKYIDEDGEDLRDVAYLVYGLNKGAWDNIVNTPGAIKELYNDPSIILDVPSNFASAVRGSFRKGGIFGDFGTAENAIDAGESASGVLFTLIGLELAVSFPVTNIPTMPSTGLSSLATAEGFVLSGVSGTGSLSVPAGSIGGGVLMMSGSDDQGRGRVNERTSSGNKKIWEKEDLNRVKTILGANEKFAKFKKPLKKVLKKYGWKVDDGGKHGIIFDENNNFVSSLAKTPSDVNTGINDFRTFRAALRDRNLLPPKPE